MQRNPLGFLPFSEEILSKFTTEVESKEKCLSFFPEQKRLYKFNIDKISKRLEAEVYAPAPESETYELIDKKSVIELLSAHFDLAPQPNN